MKSPRLAVWLYAAIGFLWMTQAKSEEPGNAATAAAAPLQGKEAGEVRDDNGLKMKLIWCPPGFFAMENVEFVTEPVDRKAEEKPNNDDDDVDVGVDVGSNDETEPEPSRRIVPVKVVMTKGYWLGKYEVTQGEWK